MFSSSELIEALRRRARPTLRPELAPGHFPPGWQSWFAAMRERIDAIRGASAEAILSIFLQRELRAAPRRVRELNRWQAFATLWRQEWQSPTGEDRRQRFAALAISIAVQLMLFLALLWLGDIHLAGTSAPLGEEIVQVEYIGTGTPADTGGGAPGGQPQPIPSPAPPAAASAPAPSVVARAPAPSSQPAPSESPSPPQPATQAQPLQVTEVAVPDTPFVLSPTSPPVAAVTTQLETPQLQQASRSVQVNETPLPPQSLQTPQLPQVPLTTRQLVSRPSEITLEQAPQPLPGVKRRAVPEPPVLAQQRAQLPDVQAIAMPVATSAASTVAASSTATAASAPVGQPQSASANAPAGANASPSAGERPSATNVGHGGTAAAPGGMPTPQRGDDWGASARNRPGGNTGRTPGLFNADGSPRLSPGGQPSPGGGAVPGAIAVDIPNVDRAGTWLRRKPNDFSPTSLDKYWVPNETLLAEWVRKNIREVSIPIPGTSKKLHCVVSLLQLGGGCGISDPNMQDQEAIARPPPDIPFKPDLQDDQGALRKPPPGG